MTAIIPTPNGVFEVDPHDAWIFGHMANSSNVFESHIINTVIKDIVQKSTYIVDVGANIGCHAVSYGNSTQNAKCGPSSLRKIFMIFSKEMWIETT